MGGGGPMYIEIDRKIVLIFLIYSLSKQVLVVTLQAHLRLFLIIRFSCIFKLFICSFSRWVFGFSLSMQKFA